MSISSAGYVSGNIAVPYWFGMQDSQYTISSLLGQSLYLATTPINIANNSGWDNQVVDLQFKAQS